MISCISVVLVPNCTSNQFTVVIYKILFISKIYIAVLVQEGGDIRLKHIRYEQTKHILFFTFLISSDVEEKNGRDELDNEASTVYLVLYQQSYSTPKEERIVMMDD